MTQQTSGPTVLVREAALADLPAIERLLIASSLPTDGLHNVLCDFLVAEADAVIVGVAGLERCGAFGLLRSTAVEPAWRGRHVGRLLVERIVAQAEAGGLNSLFLLTTTAERYFPSFGFATTSRDLVPDAVRKTEEFTSACPESATVMMLALASRG